MEGYQQRMMNETQELEHRIARLSLLLFREEMGELDFELNCPTSLLQEQLKTMLRYADILDKRTRFDGEVCSVKEK